MSFFDSNYYKYQMNPNTNFYLYNISEDNTIVLPELPVAPEGYKYGFMSTSSLGTFHLFYTSKKGYFVKDGVNFSYTLGGSLDATEEQKFDYV
jgi:hypothetical protein